MGRGFSFFRGWYGDGGGQWWVWWKKKAGNCEINSKLLSMCVVWVRTRRVLKQRTQGEAPTAFGSLSPWFTETGVGLQLGLGNTRLKTGTIFFLHCNIWKGLNVNSLLLCHFFVYLCLSGGNSSVNIETVINNWQSNHTPYTRVYLFRPIKKSAVCQYQLSLFPEWHFSDV